jgi:hypothetical protein
LKREGHPGPPYTHLICPHCGIYLFLMEGAAEIAAWGRRIWVFSWDSESCLLGRVTEEEVSPVVGLVDMAHPNGNHVCLYLRHGWPWGVAQQSRDLAGLCRLWGQRFAWQGWGGVGGWQGHRPVKGSSWGAVQVLGAWPSRDHAGLYRPCGTWPAEIIGICGSLA